MTDAALARRGHISPPAVLSPPATLRARRPSSHCVPERGEPSDAGAAHGSTFGEVGGAHGRLRLVTFCSGTPPPHRRSGWD
eukprot:scaffold15589_cov111-Isochrysis_galbana.AAC.7